jgi:dihydrofolate synthase/folylpolyglutamate synthase
LAKCQKATCQPIVTAVTSIGFDHTEWLGSSLDLIATEKAGIFRKGVPAVVAKQPKEALDALERVAREVGAPLSVEGQDFRLEAREGRPGLTWTGKRRTLDGLELGLKGAHQQQNAAVALACLEQAEGALGAISAEVIARALDETLWPCRLEEFGDDPLVVLDGAHNPQGAQALRTALDGLYGPRPMHLVFGVLSDKDWASMVRTLFPRAAQVHLCQVPGARGQPARPIAELGQGLCHDITLHASPRVALAAARASARRDAAMVVCCGSLYLMGELRAALLEEGLVGS